MKNSTWQYMIPQRLVSRFVGLFAECDYEPLKNFLIRQFIQRYHVDLTDAVIQEINEFESFNHFFTRALKANARQIHADPQSFVSPADGTLSEFGVIQEGQLLQAKGQSYALGTLLAEESQWIDAFQEGVYATVYLAPKDYHRVHMPLAGTLKQMMHVPGKLFSVNQKTSQDLSEIFARNERVICIFETAIGPVAVILVGAMIVASIATPWHGQVTPVARQVQQWQYQPQVIQLEKGAEMGRFYLGSTVIMLMPKDSVAWNPELVVGQALKMGQKIGSL